jgi:hypothetical protein
MNKPVNFDFECRRQSALVRAWNDFWAENKGWNKVFIGLPQAFDRLSRHFDRSFGRSYNGAWQSLFMNGHSVVPMLFMLIAIAYSVLGPTPRCRDLLAVSGMLALSGMFTAVAGYWLLIRYFLAKRTDGRGLLSLQIGLLAVLAAVFWLPASDATEAMPVVYRNLFAPIMLLLLTLALLSNKVASWVMGDFPDDCRKLFAELIHRTIRSAAATEADPAPPSSRLHQCPDLPPAALIVDAGSRCDCFAVSVCKSLGRWRALVCCLDSADLRRHVRADESDDQGGAESIPDWRPTGSFVGHHRPGSGARRF